MTSVKSILYIQHAGTIGGSVISLKELITDALASGYRCTVVCPNETIADIYKNIGAKTYVSLVSPWNHNTAYFYRLNIKDILRTCKVLLKTIFSFLKLGKIVREVKPDIVHLNSVTLIFYNLFFRTISLPTVFHVREIVVNGYFGVRKNMIKVLANKWASAIIYISEYELDVLGTKTEKSFVIYNYVHLDKFLSANLSTAKDPAHSKYTFITLGGLFSLKGGNVILESLDYVNDDVELLVLGSDDPRNNGEDIAIIEGHDYLENILKLLKNDRIGKKVKFAGRVNNAADYLRSSDAVIFWAASPHFPRPVFEGWLMCKPVLYFNPEFKSSIINAETVHLIKNNTPVELANVINKIKASNIADYKFIQTTFELAKANFTEQNFIKIDAIYEKVLSIK